jgi:hypothetical protein
MSNGESSGGSAVLDIEGLLDGISGGIETWFEVTLDKQAAQENPCILAAMMRELLATNYMYKLEDETRNSREVAAFLPMAITESLQQRGTNPPGSNVRGGKNLAEFAVDAFGMQNLMPSSVFGAFMAQIAFLSPLAPGMAAQSVQASMLQWVLDHMPTGQSIANWNFRTTVPSGSEALGNSLWLAPAPGQSSVGNDIGRAGSVYRGQGLGQLLVDWRDYQINNVEPSELTSPRAELIQLVGAWQNPSFSGPYDIWQPGDPGLPNSRLENLQFLKDDMLDIEAIGQELCDLREVERQSGARTAREQYELDAIARREQIEKDQQLQQVAIVGAFALVGILVLRMGR